MEPVEPPWWTPRKNPTARRALSREAIVATALELLPTEGIDGLSMRRVAGALGTGQASLYAHVANKEELLDLLLDEVIGEIPLPEPDPEKWQEQVVTIWTDSHAVLARNADIARVAIGRIPLGPNSLRVAEVTMAVLRAGGVPDHAVAWVIDVVGLYISATAAEGAIHAELERRGDHRESYFAQVKAYYDSLPAARYPTTVALRTELMTGDGEERFAFGLELFVSGLSALTAPR